MSASITLTSAAKATSRGDFHRRRQHEDVHQSYGALNPEFALVLFEVGRRDRPQSRATDSGDDMEPAHTMPGMRRLVAKGAAIANASPSASGAARSPPIDEELESFAVAERAALKLRLETVKASVMPLSPRSMRSWWVRSAIKPCKNDVSGLRQQTHDHASQEG
jgi:hypothetical protein